MSPDIWKNQIAVADNQPIADSGIPIIDLSTDPASGNFDTLVRQFHNAYSRLGFGMVVNHGIDPALTKALFEASEAFHALPVTEKLKHALDSNHRGYIPINTSTDVNSTLANVKKPNQSESFMVMREDTADSTPVKSGAYLAGPNQWPGIAGFKSAVDAYIQSITPVAEKLLHIASLAIGAGKNELLPLFNPPTLWLRLLHYPPCPPSSPDDLFGSAPHTDFGALTLLSQDEVGGLQVLTPDNQWIDVPTIPGALVVNVGDMLQQLSNGILKSTPHRVINHSGKERYSCVFFYDPYVDKTIEPLPTCIAANPPRRFEPLHFGDFLRAELSAAYNQHKSQ